MRLWHPDTTLAAAIRPVVRTRGNGCRCHGVRRTRDGHVDETVQVNPVIDCGAWTRAVRRAHHAYTLSPRRWGPTLFPGFP